MRIHRSLIATMTTIALMVLLWDRPQPLTSVNGPS